MRLLHFEALQPICPHCRLERNQENPLLLAKVIKRDEGSIFEGILHCSDQSCQLEYPIIDGIPIIVPGIRNYISEHLFHITARDNLSESTESILGDAVGPGTFFDSTRQHLSTYACDHYGDLDPSVETRNTLAHETPGSVVHCLETGLQLIDNNIGSPLIDIGCAVGRTTFELAAKTDGPVLGIDLNFSMLRVAQRILNTGVARYPLRRLGVVYNQQEYEVKFENTDQVDFWACDALALPFTENTFRLATGLNVLDSVTSPRDLLATLGSVVSPGGNAILATPYDWSPAATPIEAWIGGHSQRGPGHGAGEPFLKTLLTPGAHPQSVENLRIVGEITDHPWCVRIHDRSTTTYNVHIVAVKAIGS